METLITMKNVSKTFGDIHAVNRINVEVKKGEILGFLGPNASGKTTTVRLLNGVIFPDDGKIEVMGYDSVKNGNEIRNISGVLTETAALYEHMTARENLQFFADLYDVTANDAKKRGDALLERFGLADREKQKVGNFSTGLKKRLGIAKALIHNPEVLYLDEPTSGLDPESSRDLISYIKELNSEHLTVFVCTHNLAEAEHFCTRFVFLDQGSVIENGTLPELEEKYSGEIKLRVDYRGDLEKALPAGVAFESIPGELNYKSALLTIAARKLVPSVIRSISQKVDVFRAEQANSGLESLYFEIRGQIK